VTRHTCGVIIGVTGHTWSPSQVAEGLINPVVSGAPAPVAAAVGATAGAVGTFAARVLTAGLYAASGWLAH
jgi:hypothetical protein